MNILFVNNSMTFGGVERALVDNVKVLQGLGHRVDLLLRDKEGGFLSQLPSNVAVFELPLSKQDRYEIVHGRGPTIKHMLTHGHWLYAVRMVVMRFAWVVSGRRKNYDYEVVRRAVARTPYTLKSEYDLVVAYSADYPWSAILTLNWVDAKHRISWCHNEHCYNRFNKQLYRDYYSRFDAHFACSQSTANRINRALSIPGLVTGFPHLVNAAAIREKGMVEMTDPAFQASTVLLTVGRVGGQKASDVAVRMAKRLKDSGFVGKWFWIGNGTDQEERILQKQIADADVGDCFVFLGPRQNPYPYIKRCDLYIQPSRYEGYCLTVAEARVFNRPIIATDFDGARDQINDGETGLIVPENDEDALYGAIDGLLKDRAMREGFSARLSQENADTCQHVTDAWKKVLEDVR